MPCSVTSRIRISRRCSSSSKACSPHTPRTRSRWSQKGIAAFVLKRSTVEVAAPQLAAILDGGPDTTVNARLPGLLRSARRASRYAQQLGRVLEAALDPRQAERARRSRRPTKSTRSSSRANTAELDDKRRLLFYRLEQFRGSIPKEDAPEDQLMADVRFLDKTVPPKTGPAAGIRAGRRLAR